MARRIGFGLLVGITAAVFIARESPGVAGRPRPDQDNLGIPGGRPEDASRATNDPHEFAWRLFFALNRQAELGTAGVPDPDRPTIRDYDPDRPVTWETWALASGGRAGPIYVPPNRSEVFLDRGATPAAWDDLPRDVPPSKVLEPYPGKGLDFLLKVARAPGAFDPVEDGGEGGIEVRMNRATFDYIRENQLYNIEGLEDAFLKGNELLFPRASQEIKARWVRIEEADKPRYHWRTITNDDGERQLWGLSSLHIITRDLPNWFWCDFEHVDFERFAEQYSQDPTTRGDAPPAGRDGIRRETIGSKWEHMRLRGTQTAFVDAQGRPTILANSQIEHGFQQKSSCMTCHARATVGLRSARPGLPRWQAHTLPLDLAIRPVLDEAVGAPDPDWFVDDYNEPIFLQTHFLWSLPFRALSTEVRPPE
ncbi:hypothetical protein [Tautonia rosea]|uniref:hypothetical protein n=1 Tax=Tautonia rosea TaxID=2728037 RepID=UPI0014759BFA|nr:hypothetical protein [Tautonia rosea]